MAIRTVIVDDEAVARQGIRRLLEDEADVEVVGECSGGQQAIEVLRNRSVDLVFLDVQMPVVSGFDVLRSLPAEARPVVIFVTAYDRYAIRAFEESALDYLLKPFGDDRFHRALHRARDRLRDRSLGRLPERIAGLLADLEHDSGGGLPRAAEPLVRTELQRLAVDAREGIRMVDLDDVRWIRARDYYAEIHTADRSYLLRETMCSLEGRLPDNRFVRTHRSWIVNLGMVAEFRSTRRDGRVVLRDGTEVPVARSRRSTVRARLEATG